MEYLVDMRIADSGRSTTPTDGVVFIGGLPLWPRMVTTVTPLTTWGDRAAALGPRLERLKAGKTPGEAAQPSGGSE